MSILTISVACFFIRGLVLGGWWSSVIKIHCVFSDTVVGQQIHFSYTQPKMPQHMAQVQAKILKFGRFTTGRE